MLGSKVEEIRIALHRPVVHWGNVGGGETFRFHTSPHEGDDVLILVHTPVSVAINKACPTNESNHLLLIGETTGLLICFTRVTAVVAGNELNHATINSTLGVDGIENRLGRSGNLGEEGGPRDRTDRTDPDRVITIARWG